MRKIFSILFVCIVSSAFSQTKTKINETFLFRTEIKKDSKGKFYGSFSSNFLIESPKIGEKVKVFSIRSDKTTDLENPQGVGIISGTDGETEVFLDIEFNKRKDVELIKKTKTAIVKLKVLIPTTEYRSIFFEMLKNAIYMQDVYEEKYFYDMTEILYSDSKDIEQQILEEILADVKTTATAMREQMESPAVTDGRFKETDVFLAMDNSTTEDLMSFLRYIQSRPRKYQGITWKSSEIYATWIISGAPSTYVDIIELLFKNINNNDAFRKYVKSVEPNYYDKFAERLRKLAKSELENMKYSEAEKYLLIVEKIGLDLFKTETVGWNYISYGKIHSAKQENNKAIQKYKSAIENFTKSENQAGLLVSYNEISNSLILTNKKADNKKAIKYCKKAIEIVEPLDITQDIKNILALVYQNYGNAYMNLKKYKGAIKVYNTGLGYVKEESALSLKRCSALYMQLSEVYKLLEDTKNEKKYNALMVETYKKYEDKLK